MDVDCQPFLEGLDVRDEVRVCSAGLRSDARVPLYSSNTHLFPVCVSRPPPIIRKHLGRTVDWRSNGQLRFFVRHCDITLLRREAVQQRCTWPVWMPEEAPAWAIAIDGDAALALVHPTGRAVHYCVNEEDCVARIQVYFHRAGNPVDRSACFRRHLGLTKLGMDDVRLVAAGYNHCRAIARANVVDCYQDVDLAAMKPSVMVAELAASDALMTTGMQADGLSRAADRGEIFIDKKPSVKAIEIGLIGADEMGDLVDPRGMID